MKPLDLLKLFLDYRNHNVLSHTGHLFVGPAAVPQTQVRSQHATAEHLASSEITGLVQ